MQKRMLQMDGKNAGETERISGTKVLSDTIYTCTTHAVSLREIQSIHEER